MYVCVYVCLCVYERKFDEECNVDEKRRLTFLFCSKRKISLDLIRFYLINRLPQLMLKPAPPHMRDTSTQPQLVHSDSNSHSESNSESNSHGTNYSHSTNYSESYTLQD